jgi:hypothetical protein
MASVFVRCHSTHKGDEEHEHRAEAAILVRTRQQPQNNMVATTQMTKTRYGRYGVLCLFQNCPKANDFMLERRLLWDPRGRILPTPSQPVRSRLFDFRLCENCRHSRGLCSRARVEASGHVVTESRDLHSLLLGPRTQLFYSFNLEAVGPDDHLVRANARAFDLSWVRAELATLYSL